MSRPHPRGSGAVGPGGAQGFALFSNTLGDSKAGGPLPLPTPAPPSEKAELMDVQAVTSSRPASVPRDPLAT